MTPREEKIVSSIKLMLHTQLVDPDFVLRCLDIAQNDKRRGVGLLEQDEAEFSQMLEHVKGARSVLEIGSRYGASIKRMADCMAPNGLVLSIDLPDPMTEPPKDEALRANMEAIASMGHKSYLVPLDSKLPRAIQHANDLGPFDFVFIDGDHSYDGVKSDWDNYGPLGKIVAFHDIINNKDCFRLWTDLKKQYRTVEYTDSAWLGIGVLFKESVV